MNSSEFKVTCRDLCSRIVNIEDTECIICHEEIKIGTLFLPCNHYQTCMKCASLSTDICSICRTEIKHIVNYYKKKEYGESIYSITDAINYDEYHEQQIKNKY